MEEFYTRTAAVLGEATVDRLRRAHVLVVGVGGVGSYSAEALARAGVGYLTVCDHDVVAPSNLNRQLIALQSTVGQPKAELVRRRVADIQPQCRVTALALCYGPETRERVWAEPYDFVIDAIDMVSAKVDLIRQAQARGVPIVSALGTGNKLDPLRFELADLADTSVCPLARALRRELRRVGIVHHPVLYSREEPRRAQTLQEGGRAVPGSVSWVPSCAGLMLAGYVVRQLTGV